MALAARPKPHPFVPGVELDVLCARQDLCQRLHLRSLTIEPLTAHRVACGGAPARQSDRQARGAVLPSRAELGSDWSSWGGVSSSEGPDPLCPTLDALTSPAQIPISYSGSTRGAATVRSHPSAFVRGPKRPVTRMRVQIRVSGRSARKSQWKGMSPGVAQVGHFSD